MVWPVRLLRRGEGGGGGGWLCEEAGQAAVVGGAPSVGDRGGLEQCEVAAEDPGDYRESDQRGVRARGERECRGGEAAECDQCGRARGDFGAAGGGRVKGASEGLSGGAQSECPCCLAGGVAAFQQEGNKGNDRGRDGERGERECDREPPSLRTGSRLLSRATVLKARGL